jgi:hypothetical protein
VVRKSGQGLTEYMLMLGLLTVIGILIMKSMLGSEAAPNTGAIGSMQQDGAKAIANDEKH